MRNFARSIIFLCLCLSLGILPALSSQRDPSWQQRVDAQVLESAQAGQTEFIIFLSLQADLSPAALLPTKLEKGRFVYQTLSALAEQTQKPILEQLKARGVAYRSYWVANMIWAVGDLADVQAILSLPGVSHLYANPAVRLDAPGEDPQLLSPARAQGIEWNLLQVNADDVWAAGFTGQGAVVGGADTGFDWTHPALQRQYRGWDGAAANHNYNWHDAIHADITGGGNPCGFDSPVPCDDGRHGTHTMGIMVGDDGAGNQIGMAPGARWIGCRNMEQNTGTPITYAECYQWFIAPTDLNNLNPDPAKAPDVINNSWYCPEAEGCSDPNVLLAVVNHVRAAGILTVHSAGNQGPACSSIRYAAGMYDASFTVGNTTILDVINSSSSRGPVTADGSGRLKPDITAPGTNIRSSIPGSGYASMTGTSMAAPHAAGLAVLLISAEPALAGQVDRLEWIITRSAVPLTSSPNCDNTPISPIPNNTYGWGRMDAWAAFQHRQFKAWFYLQPIYR
jgi:subtilisin family serine protease